jgi:hypothetical protein
MGFTITLDSSANLTIQNIRRQISFLHNRYTQFPFAPGIRMWGKSTLQDLFPVHWNAHYFVGKTNTEYRQKVQRVRQEQAKRDIASELYNHPANRHCFILPVHFFCTVRQVNIFPGIDRRA